MADTKGMMNCHQCGNQWITKASDGQRIKCPECGLAIMVIRYADLHPRAIRGQNCYAITGRNELAPRVNSPAPVASPSRVIQGIVTGNMVSTQSIATDVSAIINERRERKVASQRQTDNPYSAHTPPDNGNRPCAICQVLNYRPNGRFPIARYEVTTVFALEITLLCEGHAKELTALHLAHKVRPIMHIPNPGPGYIGHGIGNVPENSQLAIMREQERLRQTEEDSE